MTHAQWTIVGLAAGWSCLVGLAGLLAAYLLRSRSLRWGAVIVAVVGVGGFVAALVATADAMFLSNHDFHVVLLVSAVAGVVSLSFALDRRRRGRPVVPSAPGRGTPARRRRPPALGPAARPPGGACCRVGRAATYS